MPENHMLVDSSTDMTWSELFSTGLIDAGAALLASLKTDDWARIDDSVRGVLRFCPICVYRGRLYASEEEAGEAFPEVAKSLENWLSTSEVGVTALSWSTVAAALGATKCFSRLVDFQRNKNVLIRITEFVAGAEVCSNLNTYLQLLAFNPSVRLWGFKSYDFEAYQSKLDRVCDRWKDHVDRDSLRSVLMTRLDQPEVWIGLPTAASQQTLAEMIWKLLDAQIDVNCCRFEVVSALQKLLSISPSVDNLNPQDILDLISTIEPAKNRRRAV